MDMKGYRFFSGSKKIFMIFIFCKATFFLGQNGYSAERERMEQIKVNRLKSCEITTFFAHP